MKIDYLIDSNIVIYMLNGQKSVLDKMANYSKSTFGISVITQIEVLLGDSSPSTMYFLDLFAIVPLTSQISSALCENMHQTAKKSLRDIHIQDFIIGTTAKYLQIPLITTNQRDFKNIKDLELITISLTNR